MRLHHALPPQMVSYHYIARNKKQTYCQLHPNHLVVRISAKNGEAHERHFSYNDIRRIHLSLPDISWHSIDLYFKDQTHIHLKSLVFFLQTDNQKFKRPKTDLASAQVVKQTQAHYRDFVCTLHERIRDKKLNQDIIFSHGNPWLKTLIYLFLIALVIAIPITFRVHAYKVGLFFCVSFLVLLLFSFRINFKKGYDPSHIPEKYLP